MEARQLLAVDFSAALGAGGPFVESRAVVTDSAGNSFVAGDFSGTAQLDPSATGKTLTSTGAQDISLAEYSPSGALLWAEALPGSAGSRAQANGLAIDGAGNLVLTGSFSGSRTFNSQGGNTLTALGGPTPFSPNSTRRAALSGLGSFMGMVQTSAPRLLLTRPATSSQPAVPARAQRSAPGPCRTRGRMSPSSTEMAMFSGWTASRVGDRPTANPSRLMARGNVYTSGIYENSITFSG